VTKQVLEDTYIDSAFQHMSGEAVAQCVTHHFFINSGLVRGPLHRFLQDGFQNMMTHFLAGARVCLP